MSNFTPYSKFYLIKDVDIDISYNHEYYFESEEEQRTFFQSKIFKTVENGTYQRKNSNTIAVPFLADEIRECKYVMWKNDVDNKWWYAFVTSVNYVNPSVSNITYQLDVYQSYLFDMEWKESFVERKHCKQYESRDGLQMPTVNTAPEVLDYGDSYRILKKRNLIQIPDISFLIVGFSEPIDDSVDTSGIAGASQSIQNIPTNLYYYVVPIYVGHSLNKTVYFYKNGEYTKLFNAESFISYCSQSEFLTGKMVSAVIMPFLTIGDIGYSKINDDKNIAISCDNLLLCKFRKDVTSTTYNFLQISLANRKILQPYEITSTSSVLSIMDKAKYSESKLYMYPYSFTELTTERGDTFIIKNEYIKSKYGDITIQIYGTINFQNKMSFIVKDYLSEGSYLENGIHDSSNANVPIIDDYTASYLQSNSNSIAVARSNALASQNAEISNAERTQTAKLNIASRDYNYNSQKAFIGNAGQIAGGIGQALGGNLAGGLATSISGIAGLYTDALYADTARDNSNQLANTNFINTMVSASTNYSNAIATIDGKYQDAQQVPNTVRSMGGDYLYNIAYYCDGIYLLEKTIMEEPAKRLENYFKHYGYSYNQIEVPEFYTRENWNYIKLTEPNVSGNIPMDDLLSIKGIFQNGITLWHGDYIGDYSKDNKEVS